MSGYDHAWESLQDKLAVAEQESSALRARLATAENAQGAAEEETFQYRALADELEGTLRKIAERALNGSPYHNAQEMCAAAEGACEAYRYACLSPELRAAEDRGDGANVIGAQDNA